MTFDVSNWQQWRIEDGGNGHWYAVAVMSETGFSAPDLG